MRIADNVEILEINGERGALYLVLVWDDNELVLIDAVLPGQIKLMRAAVSQAGFSLEKIIKVIITHQDMDHMRNEYLEANLQTINGKVKFSAKSRSNPEIIIELIKINTWDMRAARKIALCKKNIYSGYAKR